MNIDSQSLQQLLLSHDVSLTELCQQFDLDEQTIANGHQEDPYGRFLATLAEQKRLPALYRYLKTTYPETQWGNQGGGVFIDAQRDVALDIQGDLVGGNKISAEVGSGAAVIGDHNTAVGERGANIQGSTLTNSPTITGDYNQVIIGTLIDDIENLPPEKGESPYKGLEYFTEEDAEWFFGRDAATAKLINRLHDLDFLAVVGASGSGKSSLVRAGVIPVMKRMRTLPNGLEPPTGHWHVHTFTPTARPMAKLTAVQQQAQQEQNKDSDHKLLLFVDQFEELFTLCEKEDERLEFINNLLTLANSNDTKIIITIRADFYEECIRYEQLRELFTANQELLGQMTTEELKTAILQPAAKGNWQFQAGLTEEILDELGNEPGRLPLLSHALYETWQARRGRVLTFSGYREAGKVQGAIAKTVEATYVLMSEQQQKIARNIFLRLTEPVKGASDTRRRISWTELDDDASVKDVIQQLADKRLITTTQDSIDVAHEALIRSWPRLQQWLEIYREDLLIHRKLTNATQEWLDNNQDKSLLYSGIRFAEVQNWPDKGELELTKNENMFLQASYKQHLREKRFRNSLLLGATIVTIIIALLAIINSRIATDNSRIATDLDMALQESESNLQLASTREAEAAARQFEAEYEQQLALALSLASQAPRVLANPSANDSDSYLNDTELASLLTVQAINIHNRLKGKSKWSLYDRTSGFLGNNNIPFNHILQGHEYGVESIAFSNDGRYMASFDPTATIKVWDLQNPSKDPITLDAEVPMGGAIAFSKDGYTLVHSGFDPNLRLWDVNTIEDNQEPIIIGSEEIGFERVYSVTISPNGNLVATGRSDNNVHLWDITKESAEPIILKGHSDIVLSVAFSHDGKTLASGSEDETVRLWDLNTFEEKNILHADSWHVNSVAFSPNGTFLASGSSDWKVRLWNLQQLSDPPVVLESHIQKVRSVAFSNDSRFLISAGDDQTVHLWNLSNTSSGPVILRGHESYVKDVSFSSFSNGYRWASADLDGIVRIWHIRRPIGTPRTLTYRGAPLIPINHLAISSNGTTIASNGEAGILIWDSNNPDLQSPRILEGHTDSLTAITFSPINENILASASTDNTIRIWDLQNSENNRQISNSSSSSTVSLSFSPDGQILASTDSEAIKLWDLNNITNEPQIINEGAQLIAFSPDGEFLASVDYKVIHLWNLNDLNSPPIELTKNQEDIEAIAFSPNGNYLASGGGYFPEATDTAIRLWSMNKLDDEPLILSGHSGTIFSLMFSPDESILASGSEDSTIRLWDLNHPEDDPIILESNQTIISDVVFTSDGNTLVSGSWDGTINLWPTLKGLVQETCKQLTWRNMSLSEWNEYIGANEYECTCPNRPPHPTVTEADFPIKGETCEAS